MLLVIAIISFIIGAIFDQWLIPSTMHLFSTPLQNNENKSANIPPEILSVTLTNVTTDGAVVLWVTKNNTTGKVIYCKTTYGENDVCLPSDNNTLSKEHTITLKNLNPATTYDIKIQCRDEEENETILNLISYLKTQETIDEKRPEFINISAPDITPQGISLIWNTNKPTTCYFLYWSDPVNIHIIQGNTNSIRHSVAIPYSDISQTKPVNYCIVAVDTTGKSCISNIASYKSK